MARWIRSTAVSAMLVSAACRAGESTAPVFFRPTLSSIDASGSVLYDGGILTIRAYPVDTELKISDRLRIWVRVTTTSGDAEDVDLERMMCGGRECAGFSVSLRDASSVDSVRALLATFPARVGRVESQGRFLSGRVFRNSETDRVIQAIRLQPDVSSVERSVLFCALSCPPWDSWLAASRSLDDRVPVQLNDRIEAAVGDTITITYQQRDASTISHKAVMRLFIAP